MSKAKNASAASKRRRPRREGPVVQDRAAHFSSDWVIVIDGAPVAAAGEDGIAHMLPQPGPKRSRARHRREDRQRERDR